MGSPRLIVCVGNNKSLQSLREKVLSGMGVSVILSDGLCEGCEAAAMNDVCGVIIASDYGWDEQCAIEAAISAINKDVPVLKVEGVLNPANLLAFIKQIKP